MGYLHIDNLYKNQDILLFNKCYAMEKIHGTSAHVSYTHDNGVRFFSGGVSREQFVKLWGNESSATNKNTHEYIYDYCKLLNGLKALGSDVVIYGEAYGGKCQKMSATYGPNLRFVAFDVKIDDCWLAVPQAAEIAAECGLDFVWWAESTTKIAELDKLRDRDSEQAKKNGMGDGHKMEGIIIRPTVELTKNNGKRIIVKHKRDDFRETATPRKVIDPAKLEILAEAAAISEEWCTEMRLLHVLDKMDNPGVEQTRDVIHNMCEDIKREGEGEIVWSKEAGKAIGKLTAQMFKKRLQAALNEQ